jgi:hypothetical protein
MPQSQPGIDLLDDIFFPSWHQVAVKDMENTHAHFSSL